MNCDVQVDGTPSGLLSALANVDCPKAKSDDGCSVNVVSGDEASNARDAVTATLTDLLLSHSAASPRADTASKQLDISGRSLQVTTAAAGLASDVTVACCATDMDCCELVLLTTALLPAECATAVLSLGTVRCLSATTSTAALLECVGCWPHVELGVAVVLNGCGVKEPNLKPPLTFQVEPVLNGGFTVCTADHAKTLSEPALNVDTGFSRAGTAAETEDDKLDDTALPTTCPHLPSFCVVCIKT